MNLIVRIHKDRRIYQKVFNLSTRMLFKRIKTIVYLLNSWFKFISEEVTYIPES